GGQAITPIGDDPGHAAPVVADGDEPGVGPVLRERERLRDVVRARVSGLEPQPDQGRRDRPNGEPAHETSIHSVPRKNEWPRTAGGQRAAQLWGGASPRMMTGARSLARPIRRPSDAARPPPRRIRPLSTTPSL